jgi:antitoxin (DNA-binding transcriptional repressor) of toxin-antitoxin stability system
MVFMETKLSKSRFKPRVLEYLRQVEHSGEPIIVTDHGRPVIEIRRYIVPDHDPLERLRGSVKRYEEPFEPVNEDDWETSSLQDDCT